MRKIEYKFNGDYKVGYIVKEIPFSIGEGFEPIDTFLVCTDRHDADKLISAEDWRNFDDIEMEMILRSNIISEEEVFPCGYEECPIFRKETVEDNCDEECVLYGDEF